MGRPPGPKIKGLNRRLPHSVLTAGDAGPGIALHDTAYVVVGKASTSVIFDDQVFFHILDLDVARTVVGRNTSPDAVDFDQRPTTAARQTGHG